MTTWQLQHFAVRNVIFTPIPDSVIVTCYTNYPVHLWLRWTETEPEKHIHSTITRGANIGTYIDQCFVVFNDLEQDQTGDTYTHTFTFPSWPYCVTRWFYFWGTIGAITSPSASAIFKYHNVAPSTTTYRIYIYTYVYRLRYVGTTWENTRSHPTGNVSVNSQYTQLMFYWYNNPQLDRCVFYFPLSILPPGKQLWSATIHGNHHSASWTGGNWFANYHCFLTWPSYNLPPISSDYSSLLASTHEFYRYFYPSRYCCDVTEDIPIPFNLLQAFQGKSHLAIATRFSADVDNVPRNQWDYWGGAFERDYNGNTAYVDITVKDS